MARSFSKALDAWNSKIDERQQSKPFVPRYSGYDMGKTYQSYFYRLVDYSRGKYLDFGIDSILLKWLKNNVKKGFIKKSSLKTLKARLMDGIILGSPPEVFHNDFVRPHEWKAVAKYELDRITKFIEETKTIRFKLQK